MIIAVLKCTLHVSVWKILASIILFVFRHQLLRDERAPLLLTLGRSEIRGQVNALLATLNKQAVLALVALSCAPIMVGLPLRQFRTHSRLVLLFAVELGPDRVRGVSGYLIR